MGVKRRTIAAPPCPVCGATQDPLREPWLHEVSTRDLPALSSFLRGDLDRTACAVCATPQEQDAFILVRGDGWAEVSPGRIVTLEAALASVGLEERDEIVVQGDAGALRAATKLRLAPLLDRVAPLFATLSLPEQVLRPAYAALTAEATAAIGLMHSDHLQPPAALRHLEGDGEGVFPDRMPDVQHRALLLLGSMLHHDETATLEGLVERYISASTLPALTLHLLDQRTDELVPPTIDLDAYVARAVQALAHRTTGTPNPGAGEWTRQYVGFALGADESLGRFAITADRARETLDVEQLSIAFRGSLAQGRSTVERMREVLEAAGFPDLPAQILASREVAVDRSPSPSTMVAEWFATLGVGAASEGLRQLFRGLVRAGRIGELEPLADEALSLTDGSADARGEIETVLGSTLVDAGQPARFLDRVGVAGSAWEGSAVREVRLKLGVERSRALEACGRLDEAYELTISLMEISEKTEELQVLQKNLAVHLDRRGSPERAAEMLDALRPEASGDFLLDVLEAVFVVNAKLGRNEVARSAAREILSAPHYGQWVVRATAAAAYFAASEAAGPGDVDAAVEALTSLDYEADPRAASYAAQGATHLIRRGRGDLGIDFLNRLIATLVRESNRARESENVSIELDLTAALGLLLDELDKQEAYPVWRRRMELLQGVGREDALTLISLARQLWRVGDFDDGRRLLERAPSVLRSEFDRFERPESGFPRGRQIRNVLARLMKSVLASGHATSEDVRLIAELQRFGHQSPRRGTAASADGEPPPPLATDAALRQLRPKSGRLHVVEWAQVGNGLGASLTTIDPAGGVHTDHIGAPRVGVFFDEVGPALNRRLDSWLAGRPGDPFDFAPWRGVEEWVLTRLEGVEAGDHVVFFGHELLDGVPFHAVAGAPWTSSYASGWSHLLSLTTLPPARELVGRGLGVVSVNARDDSHDAVAAFSQSVAGLRAIGAERDCPVEITEGTEATAEVVLDLLASCGVLWIQAHGYVAPEDDEVALMLAHGGRLPTQHAVASAAEVNGGARFSWRDASLAPTAPPLVLVGACSTGLPLMRGLGERVGLHGALHSRGNRAVIAPAWDSMVEDTLTMLNAVLRRYLHGEDTLAACLRAACSQAESELPRWRAWPLALEGDWR